MMISILFLLAAVLDSLAAAQRKVPLSPADTLAVSVAEAQQPATASGVPVVLIPGVLGGAYGFRRLAPALASLGHASYIVEPLGIGGSSHPRDADYSLDVQADRVSAVMDSLGVRNAIVVGFNLGASIALRLAYRHPECVSSVLSIDGGPVDRPTTSGVSVAMRLAPLLRLFGARGMARRRIRSALTEYAADPWWVTDSVVDGYARPLTNDIGASLRVMEAANHSPPSEPLAENLWRIKQPVRLLVGAANRRGGIGGDEVALLSAALPDFGVDSVAESGAYVHEERMDAVVASVEALGGSVRVARSDVH